MPSAGATRSTCGPRVDPVQTCVGRLRRERADAEHAGLRGREASRPAIVPPLPTAATTSAPESSQRAQRVDERARGRGRRRDVDDLRALPAQPAERRDEPVREHRFELHGPGPTMRAESSVASGHEADDADVGAVGDEHAGDGGAVAERILRARLAAGREVQERRLARRRGGRRRRRSRRCR